MDDKTFDPDKIIANRFEKIPVNMRVAFFAAFVWGIVTHLYMMTNKFPNPDDTRHMFDLGVSIAGGRFGLAFLSHKWFNSGFSILPTYSMPWLNGIISIIFIGMAAAVITNVLNVRKKTSCALISFIMVSYPTVTGTLHYMFTAPAYFLALLLSVTAVWFGIKKKFFPVAICEIALVFCLSVYQAYFWVAIGLFIMALFFEGLTDHVQGRGSFKKIVWNGFIYLSILIFALIAYAISNKIILYLTNLDLVQYGGLNNLFSVFNIDIWYYIKLSYFKFFENAWNPVEEGALFRRILFDIILVLCLFQLIVIVWKSFRKKSAMVNFALLLIALVFPLGAGSIYVASRQFVHTLMIFPTALIFVFAITLADRFIEWENERYYYRYLYRLTGIGVLLFAINYSIIANAVYLGSQITTSQALTTLNRLGTHIEMVDGFDININPVAFIGSPNSIEKPQTLSELYSLNNVVGVCFENIPGTDYEENVLLNSNANTNYQQMERYLGIKYIIASNEEKTKIMASNEFEQMPVYPAKDSIKMIDGVLVVKFSDAQ